MFRLPVSGIDVDLRPATGLEDLLLLEGARDAASVSIALVEQLARKLDGGALNARDLTVTDMEALVLELRRRLLGEWVESRGRCPSAGCGAAIDISFRAGDYASQHRSRMPTNSAPLKNEPGWFQLTGSEVQFRLVTAGDLAAAMQSANPERELARRTIRSGSDAKMQRANRAVQRAMQSLAPPLSGEIEGRCPECGATARFWFDVQSFVQREMRYSAEFLYDDVHVLASRYHWTEDKILSLPRTRRMQYVEMALRRSGGN